MTTKKMQAQIAARIKAAEAKFSTHCKAYDKARFEPRDDAFRLPRDRTNKQLVKVEDQIADRIAAYAAAKQRFREVHATLNALESELNDLMGQRFSVVDGVAISEGMSDTVANADGYGHYTIRTAAHDLGRCAEVYLNQHNKVDWGLRISCTQYPRNDETWCGTGYRFADAAQLAQDYVIHNRKPSDTARAYAQFKGQVDPHGLIPDDDLEIWAALKAVFTAHNDDMASMRATAANIIKGTKYQRRLAAHS